MKKIKYFITKCENCPYFHQLTVDEDKWCEKHEIIVNPYAYPCTELQEEAIEEEREKYKYAMKRKKEIKESGELLCKTCQFCSDGKCTIMHPVCGVFRNEGAERCTGYVFDDYGVLEGE